MRGSQPSLGRTRSSSNVRPNHIPLPPNNTNANSSGGFFGRPSGPGTPTSPNGTSSNGNGNGGVGIGGGSGNGRPRTPGSTNPENAPLASPSSPRSSFLPSFMQRSRPRSSTLTRLGSFGNPPSGNASGAATGDAAVGGGSGGSGRTGSSSGLRPASSRAASANDLGRSVSQPLAASTADDSTSMTTYRIRLVPHLETHRSVHFEPVVRDLKPCDDSDNLTGRGTVVKIGRFTEKAQQAHDQAQAQRQGQGQIGAGGMLASETVGGNMARGEAWRGAGGGGDVTAPSARDGADFGGAAMRTTVNGNGNAAGSGSVGAGGGGPLTSNKVAFRSKVVSRAHAEFWVEAGGQFYIRDTHSSSGTFLNHIRLSNPTHESRPFSIKDGDIIQLGVDYQGGTEEMYRCIKMKVEVGREKRGQNNFNKEAMKQLKVLGGVPETPTSASTPNGKNKVAPKASVTDCCICLFSVTVCQALFIAPCSHVFHYKCIRPILEVHHPGFSCPLCRTFHDLDADVELEDAWEVASRRASVATGRRVSQAEGANDEPIPLAPPIPVINGPEGASFASSNDGSANEDGGHMSDVPPSPASSRPNMSLGALPIPTLGGPASNGNPDYAGLDAATPMNNTFLSTLADLPNPPDSVEPRRPLDNVVEDEPAETELDETSRRVEVMYT